MEDELFRGRLVELADSYSSLVPRTGPANALRNASGGQVRLYENLKGGGTTTFKNYDRCVQWFADNWPENAKWPEGISRPASTPKENADGE